VQIRIRTLLLLGLRIPLRNAISATKKPPQTDFTDCHAPVRSVRAVRDTAINPITPWGGRLAEGGRWQKRVVPPAAPSEVRSGRREPRAPRPSPVSRSKRKGSNRRSSATPVVGPITRARDGGGFRGRHCFDAERVKKTMNA
jgi:hypothetical protein